VREVDGHDFEAIEQTLCSVPFSLGRPSCVIAHTHKGQGVSFMRDNAVWHHRVPVATELEAALKDLDGIPR